MLAYVSYCANDFKRVKPLLLQLGLIGYSVHFEQKTPAALTRWKDVLASIRECDLFLLALTESALRSEARMVEYEYALSLGKPVLTILLTDMQVKIPSGYINVLDYRIGNPQKPPELKQEIRMLPSATPMPTDVIPDWLAPLTRVQALMMQLQLSVGEQDRILHNANEALERRETVLAGELLLELFVVRKDLDPRIKTHIQQIMQQIRRNYARQRRTRWQYRIFAVLVLMVLLGVASFFISRRLAPAPVSVSEATAEVTAAADLTQEATAEITPEADLTEEATQAVDDMLPNATATASRAETTSTVTPRATRTLAN